MYQWCEFKSRRGRNTNLTALKSDSNTVGLICRRIYIYTQCMYNKLIYILVLNYCQMTSLRHQALSKNMGNSSGHPITTWYIGWKSNKGQWGQDLIKKAWRSYKFGWFIVFNATFNNISIISWQLVLLGEETGILAENHRPVESHWQTLSHDVISSTPHHKRFRTHNVSGDGHWLHR